MYSYMVGIGLQTHFYDVCLTCCISGEMSAMHFNVVFPAINKSTYLLARLGHNEC